MAISDVVQSDWTLQLRHIGKVKGNRLSGFVEVGIYSPHL